MSIRKAAIMIKKAYESNFSSRSRLLKITVESPKPTKRIQNALLLTIYANVDSSRIIYLRSLLVVGASSLPERMIVAVIFSNTSPRMMK